MDAASTTDDLKETAEYYVEALSLGLVSADEAVAWCDEVITAHPDPPLAIIRASMAKGKKVIEVARELAQLEGECEQQAVIQRLFGLMYELLKQDSNSLLRIVSALDDLRVWDEEGTDLSQAMKAEIRYFDYRCDLLRTLTKEDNATFSQLVAELLDFLQKALQGETTAYAEQGYRWEYYPVAEAKAMRRKLPGLVFEALVVGWLTAIAILLMRSQGQAGGGIGWGEVFLVFIIVALYFGINRWRKKK